MYRASAKPKAKRCVSELEVSEDEGFNDLVEDGDEECGAAKEKARKLNPKAKEPKFSTARLAKQSFKASKAELDVAGFEMINLDIPAPSEDGGLASCCGRKLACMNLNRWSNTREQKAHVCLR